MFLLSDGSLKSLKSVKSQACLKSSLFTRIKCSVSCLLNKILNVNGNLHTNFHNNLVPLAKFGYYFDFQCAIINIVLLAEYSANSTITYSV